MFFPHLTVSLPNDMKKKIDRLKKSLSTKPAEEEKPSEFVSFGSTLLNLGVTGHPKHGLAKGAYCLLVGGSNSGKTWLTLTAAAEACYNDAFSDYRLIYNGPEDGAKMDIRRCFGRLADKLELLTPGDGASASPEEFYDHLDECVDAGPCLYILDSMDSLLPKDDEDQVAKEKKARETGKEVGGSYGTAKARINSQRLRVSAQKVAKSGSILFIISQTRENIGFGSQFNPETRSGGKALEFYAQTQIWLKKKQSIDRPYKGIQEQVGAVTAAKVKRTRFTGRMTEVEFPIYFSAGLDDYESCVRWLIEYKHWKGDKTKVDATPEFDGYGGTIDGLAKAISEDPKWQIRLRNTTAKVWRTVEEHIKVERKSRYE